MLLGLILRFFLSEEDDGGIGRTPMFLYIVQFFLTVVLVLMLISGEIHKPAGILMCFPLLMSRVGRGAIILMLSLPLTNFLEAYTAILAIICACVGVLNMSLGWRDGVIELKYAEEGVPERGSLPSKAPPSSASPGPQNYARQPVATASPGPSMPPASNTMNRPAALP